MWEKEKKRHNTNTKVAADEHVHVRYSRRMPRTDRHSERRSSREIEREDAVREGAVERSRKKKRVFWRERTGITCSSSSPKGTWCRGPGTAGWECVCDGGMDAVVEPTFCWSPGAPLTPPLSLSCSFRSSTVLTSSLFWGSYNKHIKHVLSTHQTDNTCPINTSCWLHNNYYVH